MGERASAQTDGRPTAIPFGIFSLARQCRLNIVPIRSRFRLACSPLRVSVLFDGTELEFRNNGQWIKVDCGMNPLPNGILPANTAKYLTAKFPMNFATHIKYEHKRYEVELNNDLDLLFDKNGNFIGIDD